MFFLFWSFVIGARIDGEGGIEDETRSVSGFLHFDTATKGEALGIVVCYRHITSLKTVR